MSNKKLEYEIECPHCNSEIEAEITYHQLKGIYKENEEIVIDCPECGEEFDVKQSNLDKTIKKLSKNERDKIDDYINETSEKKSNKNLEKGAIEKFLNLKISEGNRRSFYFFISILISAIITFISYILTKMPLVKNIVELIREIISDYIISLLNSDFMYELATSKYWDNIIRILESIPQLNYFFIGMIIGTWFVFSRVREDLYDEEMFNIANLFILILNALFIWLFVFLLIDIMILLSSIGSFLR